MLSGIQDGALARRPELLFVVLLTMASLSGYYSLAEDAAADAAGWHSVSFLMESLSSTLVEQLRRSANTLCPVHGCERPMSTSYHLER